MQPARGRVLTMARPTPVDGGQKVAALYQTNVEGTRNLLTAFADARQGRGGTFIYISSTESAPFYLFLFY